MKTHLYVLFAFVVGLSSLKAQGLFKLKDSALDSPAFKARFLASYGVNGKIEPTLSADDQKLFREVLPLLEKNPKRAIAIVCKQVDSDSNAALDFLLGNLYYQQGQYQQAEASIRLAIKKMPDFRRAYRTLALILTRREQTEVAIDAWRKVIALGGGDAQSYGLLGYLLLSQQHYASALTAYEQARLFAPESEDFKRGLAHCLLETGQRQRTITLFDELIEARPDEQDYWLMQANAFLAEERFKDAIANLIVASKLAPVGLPTSKLLGDLYLNEGMVKQALEAYLNGLESTRPPVSENDADILVSSLRNLIGRQEDAFAQQYLERLEERLGTSMPEAERFEIKRLNATLLLAQDEVQEAINILKALAQEKPLDGKVLMTLAEACVVAGEMPEAIFYYERAALLEDFKADAYVELARLRVRENKLKEALEHLRIAQQLKPSEHVRRYREQIEQALRH